VRKAESAALLTGKIEAWLSRTAFARFCQDVPHAICFMLSAEDTALLTGPIEAWLTCASDRPAPLARDVLHAEQHVFLAEAAARLTG
jgi:hypothetical protein